VRERYRTFLPLMPYAVEQFDLSPYSLVISSSYAVAKGVITGPDQLHICYCHSPMRYAWDLQNQYLQTANLATGPKSWLARLIFHYMRQWDFSSQSRVDHFVANSEFVSRRIQKTYRRTASVIHPPVSVDAFPLCTEKEDYYLTVSRLVPYKMIGLIVEAFTRMPHLQLRVVGEGPEYDRIRAKAGPNVTMLGYQSSAVVREQMQRAKAFVFAAEEDFGIVPVEAQACGTPVVAFGKGGVRETVVPGRTGLFFNEQTPESIIGTIEEFESGRHQFDPAYIREHAQSFSAERFREEFAAEVEAQWAQFSDDPVPVSSLRSASPQPQTVAPSLDSIV
jgi:glycosyltransferase involved in cell wall biosynthesis